MYQPLPAAGPVEASRPLVVFFYGGTWTNGDRASYRFVGEALAARGAVVVVPDYGLSPAFTYPVSCATARWPSNGRSTTRRGSAPTRSRSS